MSKRLDIMAPRPKSDGGTFWKNVGTAWVKDDGKIQLVFDALPLPDKEGRCVVNLFEPREGGQARGATPRQTPQMADLDDDTPF